MSQIIMKKQMLDSYHSTQSNNKQINTLGMFLMLDGGSPTFVNFFLDWLRSSKKYEDGIGGDTVNVSKTGETIKLDNNFTDDEDDTEEEKSLKKELYFETSRDEMIEILEQWLSILTMDPRPDEVIIEQDSTGKVTMVVSKLKR